MKQRAYPEPTVGALIFDPEDRILLLKGEKHKNRYVIPGGHIEIGETIEQAVEREVKEETGLEVYNLKLLGLQDSIFNEFYYQRKHFIYIDFACRTDSNEVRLNGESEEYVWIKPEESFSLALDPYTRRLIEEYLRGEKSAFCRPILYNYKH